MSDKNNFFEKIKDWLITIGILLLILFVIAAWFDTCNSKSYHNHPDYDPSMDGMIRPD